MEGLGLPGVQDGCQGARLLLRQVGSPEGVLVLPVGLEAVAEALEAEIRLVAGLKPARALIDATEAPSIIYVDQSFSEIMRRREIATALAVVAWQRKTSAEPAATVLSPQTALPPECERWVLEFASELLMPSAAVESLLSTGHTTDQIARRCCVTETMVLEKLAMMS